MCSDIKRFKLLTRVGVQGNPLAASNLANVTVKASQSWSSRFTMRARGVKPDGIFVSLTFAKAPLLVSLTAPKWGEDAARRLVMPAFSHFYRPETI